MHLTLKVQYKSYIMKPKAHAVKKQVYYDGSIQFNSIQFNSIYSIYFIQQNLQTYTTRI